MAVRSASGLDSASRPTPNGTSLARGAVETERPHDFYPWACDVRSSSGVDGQRESPARPRTRWQVWSVVLWLLGSYVVLSAGVLAATLLQLRNDAIVSGEKLVASFAQLAAEQTAGIVQNVEQTLQVAEARLTSAAGSGVASVEAVRREFRELLAGRPFLRALWLTDEQGRVVYSSNEGNIGLDISDRPYFVTHRDRSTAEFHLGIPFRSRTTGQWSIAATQGRRGPGGEFTGVIVAAIDPRYFEKVWTFDNTDHELVVTFFLQNGTLLTRSPFVETAMGRSFPDSPVFRRLAAGERAGSYRNSSVVDGLTRLFAFRQIGPYPGVVVVGQTMAHALAPWWKIVGIVVSAWAISVAALTGLAIWLGREWNARLDTVERYRLLFDSNPYPAVVVDHATRRILAVNDTGVEQYGWSREEFLAMTSEKLFPAEDLPQLIAERLMSQMGVTRVVQGLRNVLKDGTVIDVELSSRMIRFDGRPALLTIAHNVTDRKRMLEEVRQSEEKYRALVDSLPVGVIETTVDGGVATANTAWRRMFGFGETEDLSTVEVSKLYADPGERGAIVSKAGGESPTFDTEAVFRRRDGETFPVERHLKTIVDAQGAVVGLRGIVIDVSRRKLLEAQLQQAQKMEAVGQLSGGIAHDFNNILTVILANIEVLEEEEHLDPQLADRIGRIGRAVQRATELTRQLLAFSRKQPLRPQRTDVNDLVVDIVKLLGRTLGQQIEIVSDLAAGLWPVDIDRAQLEAALVNLCINARDAMPGGGRLRLETGNVTLCADRVALDPEAVSGDYVMLTVTDTGSGMPPDVLARVFEPFFTTKKLTKGTGLGLSMVYGFVRQSKGHIKIDSVVGHGTTVKVYLPRKDGSVTQETQAPKDMSLPRGTERVLVVEDDAQVRAGVVQQLQSLGYAITEAGDGSAGVSAFETAAEPFDLLLTDVVMPGPLNGKALADVVARRWPRTRIVFMSGFTEDAFTRSGRLEAGLLLLNKPFRRTELAQMIRRALDGT